ncbi:ABC transporter substrate-binding protein [Nonomuraea sp. NN258]|uniref:ABC transporter substrate-binding protein n=1 Tax=Nonomuraea antri TaxID=2730852 RepID=UPI001568E479|nr:ABC transporter substrate-binding protein [Nonomuraea antri]NRQ37027.1 ABC transporter substrate-binding protein [Nonomuraea antri]
MTGSRLTVGAACALTALLAAACTTGGAAPGSTGAAAGQNGTLRYAIIADANGFDPAKGSAVSDYTFARLLYASLVARDDGGKIVPRLAETWQVTPTSATFTLRKGLTCSDGKPLTAAGVAASLKRYADPVNGAQGRGLVFGPGNTVDITSDDAAGTVSVKLGTPWSDLLLGMSLPGTGIVCGPGLADLQGLNRGSVQGAGTGPYVVEKAQRGAAYTLKLRDGFTAWPGYAKLPAGDPPRTLQISVINNESTIANQLTTGALDYAAFTGPDGARFTGGGHTTITAPILRMFVVFNQRAGRPGADEKIRAAVAQALDATAFNKVYGGKGEVMKSYTDSTSPCVNTDDALVAKADPAAAKKALSGVELKLTGTNAVGGGAGNAYVQEALRAAGAEVTLRNVDNATWATEVLGNNGDWDITVMAHLNFSSSLTSGAVLLTGPTPPKGTNFGGAENPEFAKGMGAALATVDDTAKCAAWTEAQRALLTRHDVVPLATVPVTYVFTPRVKGVTPLGFLDPTSIRITS